MWLDPDDRLQKAVDRYEEGDVDAARTMLRGLERQGVISPRIDLYLGHCHLDEDRPRAALRRYLRCVSLSHGEVSAWIGIALCHGRLGRLDRALQVLRQAAILDPEREEVHCHLVHCFALTGDVAQAESHARLAMRLDPGCPHVHRHLALAHLNAGRPDRALPAWREVLARDPEHPEADVGIARCYACLGRRREARLHYLRALRGEFAAEAYAGLADLSWMEARHEDAAVQYRNALQADSTHDEARMRLAECLGEAGQLAEAWSALQPLRHAWELPADPRQWHKEQWHKEQWSKEQWSEAEDRIDPEVAGLAARLLHGTGSSAGGFRILMRLCRWRSESWAVWFQLGLYLLKSRHHKAAVRAFRRALKRTTKLPIKLPMRDDGARVQTSRHLARALGRAGRRREAVQLLAGAAHDQPHLPELHLDLAAALLARGRIGPAERALARGLGALPDHPDLWAALAELAFESGRLRTARHRIRRALRLDPRHGQALALLVRWLLDRRRYRQAVHAARAAQRVLPADHPVVKDYGRALLLGGRAREAALPLRRYVLQVPADPEGYRLLGRALEAVGDATGARSQRRLETLVGDWA